MGDGLALVLATILTAVDSTVYLPSLAIEAAVYAIAYPIEPSRNPIVVRFVSTMSCPIEAAIDKIAATIKASLDAIATIRTIDCRISNPRILSKGQTA